MLPRMGALGELCAGSRAADSVIRGELVARSSELARPGRSPGTPHQHLQRHPGRGPGGAECMRTGRPGVAPGERKCDRRPAAPDGSDDNRPNVGRSCRVTTIRAGRGILVHTHRRAAPPPRSPQRSRPPVTRNLGGRLRFPVPETILLTPARLNGQMTYDRLARVLTAYRVCSADGHHRVTRRVHSCGPRLVACGGCLCLSS